MEKRGLIPSVILEARGDEPVRKGLFRSGRSKQILATTRDDPVNYSGPFGSVRGDARQMLGTIRVRLGEFQTNSRHHSCPFGAIQTNIRVCSGRSKQILGTIRDDRNEYSGSFRSVRGDANKYSGAFGSVWNDRWPELTFSLARWRRHTKAIGTDRFLAMFLETLPGSSPYRSWKDFGLVNVVGVASLLPCSTGRFSYKRNIKNGGGELEIGFGWDGWLKEVGNGSKRTASPHTGTYPRKKPCRKNSYANESQQWEAANDTFHTWKQSFVQSHAANDFSLLWIIIIIIIIKMMMMIIIIIIIIIFICTARIQRKVFKRALQEVNQNDRLSQYAGI